MLVSDLKNYKDSLYTALCRDISEFEKNFLFIAGGILAFSITFLKDIIKIESAKAWILLFSGWGFIILAIALMMFAFLKSAVYSDKLWKLTDDFLISNNLYTESTALTTEQIALIKSQINFLFYQSKLFLKRLRYCAVASFIFGLVLFSIFVAVNLVREKKDVGKKQENKIISIKIDSLEFNTTDSSINFTYGSHKSSGIKTDSNSATKTNPTATSNTTP